MFFICRGIVASILVFLCFGVTQAKDGPFSRPHPGNLPLLLPCVPMWPCCSQARSVSVLLRVNVLAPPPGPSLLGGGVSQLSPSSSSCGHWPPFGPSPCPAPPGPSVQGQSACRWRSTRATSAVGPTRLLGCSRGSPVSAPAPKAWGLLTLPGVSSGGRAWPVFLKGLNLVTCFQLSKGVYVL